MRVLVVGGGFGGCAAALQAAKNGAQVTLLERTDMLLGTGLVGGIMNNNGRKTAMLEMQALGAGGLFDAAASCFRHCNIAFPGHDHADIYDTERIEGVITKVLDTAGVRVIRCARVKTAQTEQGRITRVITDNADAYTADAFVDATGTAGPISGCTKHGNGCAMCVLRCPSFGGRISLSALTGVVEQEAKTADGEVGSFSGSSKLQMASLSEELQRTLRETGVAIVPLPQGLPNGSLRRKACQQYALEAFRANLVLLDSGFAKLMTPYFPLEALRTVPGFENARYADPYAGGRGNSVRFLAVTPREDTLKVKGVANLFCAGEKVGVLVGHTEAIVTGTLAGYNAVRTAAGEAPLVLPRTLAVGEAVALAGESGRPQGEKLTFSGGALFERIKENGLYSVEEKVVAQRVTDAGLAGVFAGQTA